MGIDQFWLSDFREVVFNDLPYFEEDEVGNEYVYRRDMGEVGEKSVELVIYSSVHTGTERAKDEGSDAIRVKFEVDGEVVALDGFKYEKVLRKSGWDERLEQRVGKYIDVFPTCIQICEECGRPMLLRKSDGDFFAGCSGWSRENPECENIQSLS